MQRKSFLVSLLAVSSLTLLPACVGGGAAGLVGSTVAGSVATGAVASGPNRARFKQQSCEELAAEIANAQRGMINPLTIPSTQAYIKDARAVATQKGCPAF